MDEDEVRSLVIDADKGAWLSCHFVEPKSAWGTETLRSNMGTVDNDNDDDVAEL